MASGHGRKGGDIGNDLSSIAAALEEIAARIDQADRSPRARRAAAGQPSLDRIAAMVDDLNQELDAADRSTPRRSAGSGRLDEIAGALAALEQDVATLSGAAGRGHQPERHEHLDEIRHRLEALRAVGSDNGRSRDWGRPARALGAAPNRSADLDAAIAEISARQSELGREPAARRDAVPRIPQRGTGGRADQLNQIGARLDELVRKLEAAPRRAAPPTARFADEDLKALADRIAGLSAEGSRNPGLDQLRAGLDDMRRSVEDTARESTLRSIEAGYGHIIERLDDMLRRTPDTARFDAMAQQIAELRDRLGGAAAAEQIERLEQRLDALAESLGHGGGSDATLLNDWFNHFEGRLGEIAEAIVAAQDQVPGVDQGWMRRLEDQVGALARRLDELADLQERPGAKVDAVVAEIAELRAELSARGQLEIDRLEYEIRELSGRLANIGAGVGDDTAIRQLEDEVRLLGQKLDTGGQPSLAHIEDGLAQLQAMVAENRQESIAAARAAAHEVASQFAAATGGDDNGMVRRLRSELGQLQAAALDSDHRTQEALEAVHDTLKRVVDRISDLETNPVDAGEDEEPVELRPTGTDDALAMLDDQPKAQAGGWFTSSKADVVEDHRPLEPGSGKPAVGASSARRSAAERDAAGDRKADFIAAARRAAQTAAAESAEADAAGRDDRPGPLGRISRVLRKNKQPLMLAAAALVLTAGVYRYHEPLTELAGNFLADAQQQAALEPPPLPAELGPAPADDPIRDILADTGQLLPDQMRDAPSAPSQLSSDTAFAPPTDVGNHFGKDPAAPAASGFADAGTATEAPAVADTDPQTTASIPPSERSPGIQLSYAEPPMPAIDQPAPDAVAPVVADPALPLPQIGSEALRQAAANGDAAAQFEVAVRYAEGEGGAQDLAEAALWYERAATRGLAPAQYRLGSLYERGIGVARDRNLAGLWYSKAAEQGNARAMHNLAVLLSEGVDNKSDYRQALEWFKQAAQYDVRDSQYNLGVIYARGLGTAQDLNKSYMWFAIAALGGDKDAAARRDEVAGAMQPGEVAALEADVAAWKPAPLIAAANEVAAPAGGWGAAPQQTAPARTSGDDLIRQAQGLLAKRGFDVGPADGLDGPRTREAVLAFQRMAGLPANGVVDAALIEALNRDSL